MKRKIFILICLFLYLPMSGWNSRGHMLIASIAYQELYKDQKKNLTTLLKKHPDYRLSWKRDYRKVKTKMDLGEYLMLRASVWPDELGNPESPNYKYHNSKWHYINHIINFEKGHDTLLTGSKGKPNAVWAANYSKSIVEDLSRDKEIRAVYLAWLIHIIGEVHNPQHSSSLYSASYPNGDKGGNMYFVKPDTIAISLHGLWDGAVGRGGFNKLIDIRNQSHRLRSAYSEFNTNMNLKSFNPLGWSIESFNHSIKDAYMDGKAGDSPDREKPLALPESYTANMKKIGEQRALIGGLRLGNTINQLQLN